ncbi:heme A synthase [Filobacillus milosensis]|uniref:Heme A synthase n=1 Tax=Filobacillus milosensis TaxID=94137 RepID=A0A4Y8IRC1_9BACI|nr:heme A synthase [Filobacillus milosensis]TFB23334.1 heme A synthase [Filobacillus milosensis]
MKKLFQPKPVALISLISMLIVLIGGALVTKTGSGLGCGRSWPLCNGELIPSNITFELIIEFSHRATTGLAIIFVGLLTIIAWRQYNYIKETRFLVVLTIVFFILQSLLGAGAVLFEQTSLIKALHFGISLVSFASVFLLTLIIFNIDEKFHTEQLNLPKNLRIQFYSLFVYTLVVVYSGALVRHKSASLVCRDWPLCFNDQAFLFSSLTLEQWIQMGHRLLAGLLFIWVITLLVYMWRKYTNLEFIKKSWLIASFLIICQVLLGALVVITLMNEVIALMHSLFISLFFALLCYMLLLARRSAKKNKG